MTKAVRKRKSLYDNFYILHICLEYLPALNLIVRKKCLTVFIDLAKAFDTLLHPYLPHKQECLVVSKSSFLHRLYKKEDFVNSSEYVFLCLLLDFSEEIGQILTFFFCLKWYTSACYVNKLMSYKKPMTLFKYTFHVPGKSISEVYNHWKINQPDNSGDEDCVRLNQEGKLDDVKCDAKYSFICKKRSPERGCIHKPNFSKFSVG